MQPERLSSALAATVTATLASDLVGEFLKIRRDFATKTFERASPGKFVETFVQCAQQMTTGAFDKSPSVDDYLDKRIGNETSLPEGIRVCAARAARAIYTMRNKRNVAHKGEIDPNSIDLGFCHHTSAWIMAELLRNASGVTMEEAGRLISYVQAPIDSLVEEIDGEKLFLPDASTRNEILVLFHSWYPEKVAAQTILQSMSRRSDKDVRNRIRELHGEKALQGDNKTGYLLTQRGHSQAVEVIRRLMAKQPT